MADCNIFIQGVVISWIGDALMRDILSVIHILCADALAFEIQKLKESGFNKSGVLGSNSPIIEAFNVYLRLRRNGTELSPSQLMQQVAREIVVTPELVRAADIMAARVNQAAVFDLTLDTRSRPSDAALAYSASRFGDSNPIFDLLEYVDKVK